MVNKMNIIYTLVGALGLMTTVATTANAQMSDYGYNVDEKVGGYLISQCKIDTGNDLNFCTNKMVDKIKEVAKAPVNFGNHSVLFRYWDTGIKYWIYGAVNEKTKTVFLYPRGLRVLEGDSKNVNITFGKNRDRICTAGDNMDMIGDEYIKAYSDYEENVDYCVNYDDKEGFSYMEQVDTKTRLPI